MSHLRDAWSAVPGSTWEDGGRYQVTDEAVLLHAHPSSIEATVGCVQLRSQVRGDLPLLVRHFKENAVGHLRFNSLVCNAEGEVTCPTINCQPLWKQVGLSYFDVVSVKWVMFGGLEMGLFWGMLSRKGLKLKRCWGMVKLGAASQPFHLSIHSHCIANVPIRPLAYFMDQNENCVWKTALLYSMSCNKGCLEPEVCLIWWSRFHTLMSENLPHISEVSSVFKRHLKLCIVTCLFLS